MNKVKNIVFGKQYFNIEDSIVNINDLLNNDNHPLSDDFGRLEDEEQDDVFKVIKLIEKIDYKEYASNYEYIE